MLFIVTCSGWDIKTDGTFAIHPGSLPKKPNGEQLSLMELYNETGIYISPPIHFMQ